MMLGPIIHPGARLVPIKTEEANAQATADLVWSLDFDDVFWLIQNVRPANDDRGLHLRTSADGSTFDSGASDYAYTGGRFSGIGGGSVTSTAAAQMVLYAFGGPGTGQGNGASEHGAHLIHVWRPFDPHFTQVNWTGGYRGADGSPRAVAGAGWRASSAAVRGLRLTYDTGNIAEGRFFGWGVLPA